LSGAAVSLNHSRGGGGGGGDKCDKTRTTSLPSVDPRLPSVRLYSFLFLFFCFVCFCPLKTDWLFACCLPWPQTA